jgi:pimeloyl-ACP methyl ester carboxylesterase
LADRFDLVSWDPRGVGGSTAVTCGDGVDDLLDADPDPDSDAEQAALDRAAAGLSAECATEDAQLLAHLGTADVVLDMEAIRRALGGEQLNYLGFSYGTQIGQQYAERFPTEIRAMVLDGVVDPSLGFEEFLLGQAAAFDAAFVGNATACADAGAQRCGVDDLAAAYDEVRSRVEAAPLPGGDRPVGPSVLATAAVQTGYGADGWQQLGPALAAALRGDGAPLWELAASYYDFGAFTSYAAVVCIDTPPPDGAAAFRAFADRARALSPRFGGSVANELASCATWPSAAVGTPAPVVARGAPPILVGQHRDTATPYANAVGVADSLASGVLLTVELQGHTARTAGDDRHDADLIDLVVPAPGTVCGADRATRRYLTSRRRDAVGTDSGDPVEFNPARCTKPWSRRSPTAVHRVPRPTADLPGRVTHGSWRTPCGPGLAPWCLDQLAPRAARTTWRSTCTTATSTWSRCSARTRRVSRRST